MLRLLEGTGEMAGRETCWIGCCATRGVRLFPRVLKLIPNLDGPRYVTASSLHTRNFRNYA